jgi:PAS domain S-box-containing protein
MATTRSTSRAEILLVEDQPTHVEDCLSVLGYAIRGVARNTAEALGLAEQKVPDLALIDIQLESGEDGIDAARELRTRYGIPVVYMTAHADDETLRRAVLTEPYGYVVKPFSMDDVRSAIELALHKHAVDERLAERERWFSTTLRSVADAVIACDVGQHVRFMNPSAERLLGVTESEARGRLLPELVELMSEEHVDAVGRACARALERRETVELPPRSRVKRGDSDFRIVDGSVAPIVHTGSILGAVLVCNDVTEKVRMDEQLALTDRLSALGTLVSSVAHEINNPLSFNLGNLDLAISLLADLERSSAATKIAPRLTTVIAALTDARVGADRVAKIVKELRGYGRSQEEEARPVDLRSCAQWALNLTSNQLRHLARLEIELGEVPAVMGNEIRLAQIFVNLLTNAAHAIRGAPTENEVRLRTYTDARGRATAEVVDTGIGMSPEVLGRIFEPFFTTKTHGSGTGLGLSVCRGIVESFGGEISVESTPGRGSCFRLSFPPAKDRRELGSQPNHARSGGRRGKVLVVDDEPLFRSLIARVLQKHYEVALAASAADAITLLRERRDFDLVLCDLMMPEMSGTELYAQIQQRFPELEGAVVFMTGGAFTTESAEFVARHPTRCIQKPFGGDALLAFVARSIARELQQA